MTTNTTTNSNIDNFIDRIETTSYQHRQHDDENTSLLSSLEGGSTNNGPSNARQQRHQQHDPPKWHSHSHNHSTNNGNYGSGVGRQQHRKNTSTQQQYRSNSRSPASSTPNGSLSHQYRRLASPPFSIQRSIHLCAIAAILVLCSLAAGMFYGKYRPFVMDEQNTTIELQGMGKPSSLHAAYYEQPKTQSSTSTTTTSPSKYSHAQYFGFQIYTGGAPAFIPETHVANDVDAEDIIVTTTATTNSSSSSNSTIRFVPNPECKGMPYGEVVLETDPLLMCYLGHRDALHDVSQRMQIMRDAVETAYQHSDHSNSTLKIFVAPEFYWRGRHAGAYEFVTLDRVFSGKCQGPICAILTGLESIVEDARFKDWFFLFGTIIATQKMPSENEYQHLFYNFAPLYKGFDPTQIDPRMPVGKRFLLPKRYVSDSDFLREPNLNKNVEFKQGWKELLGSEQNQPLQNDPLYVPHLRYDDHLFDEYKLALQDDAGYSMIEFDWLQIDGVTMTLEICFDHLKKTALNTYLGDMIKGRVTRIPSSSDEFGLQYIPIPIHQAQIGVVSSAGMTVNANSMALVENGTLFLQDGMTNASSFQYIDHEMWMTCDQAVQFEGGTEAVQRRAVVSNTDVNFLYQVLDPIQKVPVYSSSEWKAKLAKVFTTEQYAPHLVVHEPVTLHFPNYHS
ncbi:hypothetical protein IV203_034336 [Nitzschia inconspicua]|uniref:Uncharacterized protein n=1 Tax=Nitzschia inconspicua TaxID=303405 RepID=A0A9K3M494_9STRA|nr:hypothetical protein IV203_034336 [Nitzschia inconspicua]